MNNSNISIGQKILPHETEYNPQENINKQYHHIKEAVGAQQEYIEKNGSPTKQYKSFFSKGYDAVMSLLNAIVNIIKYFQASNPNKAETSPFSAQTERDQQVDFLSNPDNLSVPFQKLKDIHTQPKQHYDVPLPENLHHKAVLTYETELVSTNKTFDSILSIVGEHDPVILNQKKNNKIIQQYRFSKITFDEAKSKLLEGVTSEADKDVIILNLKSTYQIKHTMLTSEEETEACSYHQAAEILNANQHYGDSNCQSFVNCMENFARGLEYSQVLGIQEQLEMSDRERYTTAVACWNLAKFKNNSQTNFLYDIDSDAFLNATYNGTKSGANDNPDTLSSLNGERYIVLKSGRSGGAGHFINMVRSKATGRFFIIDAQGLRVYPLLHPNGTFTDQGRDAFNQCNVYTFRVDKIPNDVFTDELEKSNSLMQNSK